MSTTPRLSIVVIAQDEVDRIDHLLNANHGADEVVVVDSGSTDGTQERCRQAGARVIERSWAGYAAQKQWAMSQADGDWVFNLDADEYPSDELVAEMQAAIAAAPDDVVAFSMPRLSWYLGRWIRHGGWYPDRKIRLVRRGSGHWLGDGLHEKLVVSGTVQALSHPIFHLVYRNIADHVHTANRFSTVHARHSAKRRGWFVCAGVIHAIGKFLECYIWKRGILDGLPGLVIAMVSSGYVFLKHAKAWEQTIDESATPNASQR